jgi:LysM repeat protein
MPARKLIPFLLLNIVVSTVVVLAILYWWDNRDDGADTAVSLPTTVTPSFLQNTAVPQQAIATDTPEPDDGPLIHIVQAGDTLGTISGLYDVSLDDIMAENGLTNANIISIGQQIIIPIGGVSTAVPPPTAVPEEPVLPTPVPTEPVGAGEPDVGITAVIGPDQLADEAVLLTNSGDAPIALQNWSLQDADGYEYPFAQVTLFAGSDLRIHTTTGTDNPNDLYWGLDEPIWASGEVVTLRDSSGAIYSTFEVP